jgi:cytochrome c peroxidase
MTTLIRKALLYSAGLLSAAAIVIGQDHGTGPGQTLEGKRLFEDATFSGNGRTCQTCHAQGTGTVSPADAEKRFSQNPDDPLFVGDGSDNGLGVGVSRMLKDATILITLPVPPNMIVDDDPTITFITLRRGIPTTQNTPALDPVLMLDGRQTSLEEQAAGAIHDHAQGSRPSDAELHAIAEFEKTNAFFSSPAVRQFALGGPAPELPLGRTASEKRGRRFFEDGPPDFSQGGKPGLCAFCHSGPMLDRTNEFLTDFFGGLPIPAGQRFLSVGISEINALGNPVRKFTLNKGQANEETFFSPDPGRTLITGIGSEPTLANLNAFKIPQLRGIRNTGPYFHDNSAKTLEDVAGHYAGLFAFVGIELTPQDQQDMVAFMKLLN